MTLQSIMQQVLDYLQSHWATAKYGKVVASQIHQDVLATIQTSSVGPAVNIVISTTAIADIMERGRTQFLTIEQAVDQFIKDNRS